MRARHILLAAVAAVSFHLPNLAQDDEAALPASLEAPRAAYLKALEDARAQVFLAIDAETERVRALQKVAPDEQIALLDGLKGARTAFEDSGQLPTLSSLASAVDTYRARLEAPQAACKAAYDREASRLIKAGDDELARAVLAAGTALLGPALPDGIVDVVPSPDGTPPKVIATLTGHEGKVSAALFLSNNILTGSNSWSRHLGDNNTYKDAKGTDNTVRIWSSNGEQETTIRCPNQVLGMSLSQSGNNLAVSTCRPVADWCDATVSVWEAGTDNRLQEFKLPGRPGVWTPWFSSDGKTLYGIRGDSSVHILELEKGTVSTIRLDSALPENDLRCAAMDAKRTQVFGGMADGSIRQWLIRDKSEMRKFIGHSAAITAIDVSSDDRLVATASEDGTAKVFDVQSGIQLASGSLDAQGTAVKFVDSKPVLVVGDSAGKISVWTISPSTITAVDAFQAHDGAILALDIDKSGRRVLSGSADTTAKVWPLRTQRSKPQPTKASAAPKREQPESKVPPQPKSKIPPFVGENLRALRAHRPRYTETLGGKLDAIAKAAESGKYDAYSKALRDALETASGMPANDKGSRNSREDVCAVLEALQTGEWDLRKLPIHRQNDREEKGSKPELIGLPGVQYEGK